MGWVSSSCLVRLLNCAVSLVPGSGDFLRGLYGEVGGLLLGFALERRAFDV